MDREHEQARTALIRAVEKLGYPAEFGMVMAGELRGVASMQRMTAYLHEAKPSSPEEIADEMLAILDQNRAWAEQRMSEEANARYYELQRNRFGLGDDPDDDPAD